jgi:hypothetical protein
MQQKSGGFLAAFVAPALAFRGSGPAEPLSLLLARRNHRLRGTHLCRTNCIILGLAYVELWLPLAVNHQMIVEAEA